MISPRSGWRHLIHGLRVLTRGAGADRELDDELRHFADEATAAHVARGLTPDAARRAALAEIGPPVRVRERVRDDGWERWIASWLVDLRIAARTLRHAPVFALIVVAVVALGTGAVATVFSAMNAMLLRPLPGVGDPAALVAVQPARRDGQTEEQLRYSRYLHLRDHGRAAGELAAWGRATFTIADTARAGSAPGGITVLGNLVSTNYFDVLGIAPARGRFFAPDENQTPGTHPVVVVSHAFWQARLGGDPTAVGGTISVNNRPFTLVGIAPPGFHGLYTGLVVDAWAPLMMQPVLKPRGSLTGGSWLWTFGRLRPGTSIEAAEDELSALLAADRRARGEVDTPETLSRIALSPLTGLPSGRGRTFAFLGVLLGTAGLLLVIAGVNVAALLSARYLSRTRDLAVRAALGAGRLRLVRHLLTEVTLLFVLGGLGGAVVATMATAALERLPLPGSVPVTIEISPDLRVLAFVLAVSLGAALCVGLVPALHAAGRDVTDRLKADTPGGGRRRSRLARTLVVVQLALSLVLLVAAGLFGRAMERGAQVDAGFDREGVTTVALDPEAWGYADADASAFYAALRDRVAATPGVAAVTYAGRLPLMFGSSIDAVTIRGAGHDVHSVAIEDGYFDVLRLPLLRGRPILRSDTGTASAVVVVNETLARRIAPDGDVLGRTVRFRDVERTVVGVARDARYASLDETTPPFLYVPMGQVRQPNRVLLARAKAGAAVGPAILAATAALDPRLPPPRVSTLVADTSIALFPQRVAAIITGALGGIGLVLAALGLYGTIAASAVRRTREIGIRLALGAGRRSVLRDVVGEGVRLAAAGVLLGLPLAAVAMPVLRQWLFGVDPRDGGVYAGLALLLALVAAGASYVPARRAAALDPLKALRTD